jgi:hypothetical protein
VAVLFTLHCTSTEHWCKNNCVICSITSV